MVLEYQLLDVFTDHHFSGNQLAVFTNAHGLNDQQMQQVANEMNLAETVFVFPCDQMMEPQLRIFTTSGEMSFAGHPTIGAAICLAQQAIKLGKINSKSHWVFHEKVGLIPVSVDLTHSPPSARFTVAQLPQLYTSALNIDQTAQLLGLSPEQIITSPIQSSCGAPYTIIKLKDRAALAMVQMHHSLHHLFYADQSWPAFYLFCEDMQTNTIYARMFCQEKNLVEDPATGSAAAALAGVLALTYKDGNHIIHIHQGIEMGRASLIMLGFIMTDIKENIKKNFYHLKIIN